MATLKDAGIGEGGNYVKADDILESRIFQIVGAIFRAEHFAPNGERIKDQVEFEIRFLDTPEDDTTYRFGLGDNPVRRRFVTWFEQHPDDPINGMNEENGLVLYLGQAKGNNHPPKLFRDAATDEISRAGMTGNAPF